MNEPSREYIEDRMRRYGLEEKEALASYHLNRARDLFKELHASDYEEVGQSYNPMARLMHEMHYGTRFTSLQNMLRQRVLRRDYPEGWGRGLRGAREEGEDAS